MTYPLEFMIKPGNWQRFLKRRRNPKFKNFATKIFQRDHYSCHFCDFQSKVHQEVVNLDGNYRHNKPANMATACRFCVQCLFLESVGRGDFGGGRLIYIPELKQEQLNSFCHVIFCAMHNETNYNDTARTLYRDLKFRSRPIEKKFGEGTNNPHIFCQMLIEQETEKLPLKNLLDKTLKGVLLLPAFAKFSKELEDWSKVAADMLQEQ